MKNINSLSREEINFITFNSGTDRLKYINEQCKRCKTNGMFNFINNYTKNNLVCDNLFCKNFLNKNFFQV